MIPKGCGESKEREERRWAHLVEVGNVSSVVLRVVKFLFIESTGESE